MNKLKPFALALSILCAVLAAASAPVAVRVDVAPVGPADNGTRVELTVQVSPEDRARIGRNAMVRVELDGAPPPGQSPLWAVRMAADGSGTIETVWPPGEYALRVQISNPSGTDTGLWVGTVRIAGEGSEYAVPETVSETPTPEDEPPPADTKQAAEEAESPAASEEPAEASAPADSTPVEEAPAPQPTEIAEPEETPVEADEDSIPSEAPAAAEEFEKAIEEDAAVPAAPAAAGAVAGAAAVEPSRESPDPPAAKVDAVSEPDVPTPQPDHRSAPDEAVVEPLRSPPAAPTVESEAAPGREDGREEPPPASAEVVAALDAWRDAPPETVDLTVVAFRGREPAVGLEPTDFRLRVGGVDCDVSAVGDAGRAPLQLGVVVHGVNGGSKGWSGSGGRLYPLVQRAGGGRGHLFFAAGGQVGSWDGGAGEFEGSAAGELTSLITESLDNFDGRRGRKFLVVVTDGRTDADKAAWREATAAAANAGVPVLVVALWDEDFNHRVRKNLKAVAEASGGGLFLVQGSDQLDRASERFGPMLDAGVALRFEVPSSVTLPAKVAVDSAITDLDLSVPQGVR